MKEIKVWYSLELLTVEGIINDKRKMVIIPYSDEKAYKISNKLSYHKYNFRPFRGGGLGYVAELKAQSITSTS